MQSPLTTHCCISHEFSRAASRNPNRIAVVHACTADRHRDRSFTYADLTSAVDSLASQLRSDAASPNPTPRIVGVYIPPSAEYIVAVLSILRCRDAAFLPLDPSWPKHRLLSVIDSANISLVITSTTPFGFELDSDWLENASNRSLIRFSMEEITASPSFDDGAVCECESEKQRLFCYVMYTSGSTGKPKGVCGTEQGLLNRFLWMQGLYPLHGDEVLLFKTAISFVDHLQEFLSALLTASTMVIPPFNYLRNNVFSLVDYLQDYSINRLTAVPSLMRVILSALQGPQYQQIPTSLKLLVLSGEVFPLSLWNMLSKILPRTSILNLYGSTEVSGDCTYFDCKKLPMILKTEMLSSVPIGMSIASCDVVLVSDKNVLKEGEIYVAGLCNSSGYYSDSTFIPLDTVELPPDSLNGHGSQLYFRTGDFAKRIRSDDLVYLGRKDRTIKHYGQRIALEEIEYKLMEHPYVIDAAVVFHSSQGELLQLVAYIVLKEGRPDDIHRSSIKSWMVHKLPLAMIPSHIVVTESFPVSANGKVDYALLADPEFLTKHIQYELVDNGRCNLLQVIKKGFSCILMAEEVSDDVDFFMMGGNSIAAAHLSNKLGFDMRLLYSFPTPAKLCKALLEKRGPFSMKNRKDGKSEMNQEVGKMVHYDTLDVKFDQLKNRSGRNDNETVISKRLKVDRSVNVASVGTGPADGYPWNAVPVFMACSFSRCNKVVYEDRSRMNDVYQETGSLMVPKSRKVLMEELWKVYMGSCVDASPVIVCKGQDIYVFIGSHSQKFVCVNARSGSIQWEIQLDGRVECSSAILGDFTQVVVGCYKGKIYFLDSLNGGICWTFQTSGEITASCRQSKTPDLMNNILYVASTSGQVTAISIKAMPFSILWLHELEVPVFGSLAINSLNGNIICCLVDGHVIAFNTSGSIIWRYKTAGPVFAGACISSALPFQVLICSRDGSIYSLELEEGGLLWEYNVKDSITASAYVDEHLTLVSDGSNLPASRVVCVCSSSGNICLIRVNLDVTKGACPKRVEVEECSSLELAGDVFSSPVMIGGRIFVGCRDDYLHCIAVKH